MIIEAQAIRMVRTEEGKKLRKQYESHEIEHGFNEHREMELRTDGCSNTLSTVQKDNYICEKTIVRQVGRNPENPTSRKVGLPTEQRLEPNGDGICGTLTSVQKDNMVMETVKIKQATKEGYIECKIGGVADLSFPSSETRRGRVQEGGDVCPTITATETGVCRIEGYKNYRIRKMTEKEYQKAMDAYYRTKIRIRKLTPKECWRLMDFSDEDFHKAEAVNSNTQLYKQAGNSIVRNCLVAIFGQMMPGKEDDYKKGA
jgi:DNA (cytosine-5)-methyltransferase 1